MILQEMANFHPVMAILIKRPSSDFDWKIIAKESKVVLQSNGPSVH